MYNPRNSVAQQDIIDNLNSTAINLPLSANQGYLLNQRINNIVNGGGTPFAVSIYADAEDTLTGFTNFGVLTWDGANVTPKFRVTNPDIDTISFHSNTINSNGVIETQDIFSVITNVNYYFSVGGSLNPLIVLDQPGARAIIDCCFDSSTSPALSTYHLTFDCYRSSTGNIVQVYGQFTEFDNPIGQSYITFRWECSSNFAVPVNQPPLYGSWGAGEDNNAQAQSPSLNTTGVIVPSQTVFLTYSIDLNGATADRDLNFYIYQNGSRVNNTLMQVPNGSGVAQGRLEVPPTFNAGDRLNIGNINSNGATSYQANILIIASLREDT